MVGFQYGTLYAVTQVLTIALLVVSFCLAAAVDAQLEITLYGFVHVSYDPKWSVYGIELITSTTLLIAAQYWPYPGIYVYDASPNTSADTYTFNLCNSSVAYIKKFWIAWDLVSLYLFFKSSLLSHGAVSGKRT